MWFFYSIEPLCLGVPNKKGNNFEEIIRLAVSLGGDSDTLTAIAGSIAEAYYPIPEDIKDRALEFLDDDLLEIYNQFQKLIK